MKMKDKPKSVFAKVNAPLVANIVALAALLASLYSIKVTRDLAREQLERDQNAKAMQYTIALRFDVPYVPRFVDRVTPDLPERPPYLIVPGRFFFTNASTLSQAISGITFSYDGNAYYPVLNVHEISGRRLDWPLNIAPGASVAFDVDVPLPISTGQDAAIRGKVRALKSPVQSWRDFEDRVLRETTVESTQLLFALPRETHFWIETLSPSPGFPRRIVFSEWLPPKWQSGR